MNILIYVFIFLAKIIENAIATLRLIVVSNGKKMLGAILNLIISIVWILSTSLVVINIKDPIKIIVFALGSFLGSYIGSIMEEKIAIGSNMLFTITSIDKTNLIKNKLEDLKYPTYILNSDDKNILIVMVLRKHRKKVLDIIRKTDEEAIIISEAARQLVFKK